MGDRVRVGYDVEGRRGFSLTKDCGPPKSVLTHIRMPTKILRVGTMAGEGRRFPSGLANCVLALFKGMYRLSINLFKSLYLSFFSLSLSLFYRHLRDTHLFFII